MTQREKQPVAVADFRSDLRAATMAEQDLDWAEAARLFVAFQRRFPEVAAGPIGSSRALRELGRPDEAETALMEALPRFPGHFHMRFEYAQLAQLGGRRDEALRRWAELVRGFPDRPGGYVPYLTALREAGQWDEADVEAAAALERLPQAVGIWVEWARVATDRGDAAEAVRRWEAVRRGFPDNAPVIAGLAAALAMQGSLDAAAAVLRTGVERFPDRFDLACEYARLAERQRHWTEALRRWEIVRSRFPQRPSGHAGMAEALAHLRRDDQAEALLTEAVGCFPTSRDILTGLARAAHARRDWQAATERWEKVRQVAPDTHVPFVGLCHTLISARRHDEAETVLQAALGRFPEQFDLLMQQAALAQHRGDLAGSTEHWRRLHRRFPADARILMGLAGVLVAGGQRDAAEPLLDALLAQRPDHVEGIVERTRLELGRGEWRAALGRLQQAAARLPDTPAIEALLAEAKMAAMLADPDFIDEPELPRADIPSAAEVLAGGGEARRLRSLMLAFESLGDNCELGLVQRHFGAEPLGLLRWSGLGPGELTRALKARFAGVGEPENTILLVGGGEYITRDRNYRMTMHTFIRLHEAARDEIFPKLCNRLQLLRRKLLEHLAEGHKILVYKYVEGLRDEHIAQIVAVLEEVGPTRILFVRPADAAAPAGSCRLLAPGVALGHISRFGFAGAGWDIDFRGWLSLCEQAATLLPR
jgi:tetratricopeptide (TPR) repeat protein